MADSFNFAYALGMSLVPAALAATALYWRIGKMGQRPSVERITAGILMTIAATLAVFLLSSWALGPASEQEASRWDQPLMVLAGLVGFLAGKAFIGSPNRRDADSGK